MKKSLLLVMLTALFFGVVLSGCCSKPRISVLGDSYSTFKGCIPQGNACWYPRKRGNDVEKAEQCWWFIVTESVDGILEKNESWSGSTICHTGYRGADASNRSFVTRVDRLGKPDLILICGATNDSWAKVPIGEYKWSDWTKEELYSFRPAMAKMLYDIKKLYPEAKVYFILNTALRPVINDSVHKICEYYNVPCIDLKNIDKQSGHPSKAGMKAIADQVIEAVKK